MVKQLPYSISYVDAFRDHLAFIEPRHYGKIRQKIEEQLSFEPHIETRNRKPLRPSPVFPDAWELRFGTTNRFRVFYQFDIEAHTVVVMAIGVKIRSVLRIAGQEIQF
jgi:mRNA-degrading endonuclease RelE of RelBE toxin-antitoxin system